MRRGRPRLLLHAQLVCHRESSGDAAGLDIGDVFLRLAGYHACQSDVPVLDDDVDRRDRLNRVVIQEGGRVNGAEKPAAQVVVYWGRRQYFDLVDDAGHSLELLHALGGVGAGRGSQNLAQQCDTDRKSTRLNSSHMSISYAV